MLEMPPAFAIALVAILVGTAMAGAQQVPVRTRVLMCAFFLLLAVMGLLVGLRDGYGMEAARLFQPVIAMMIQPLLYLVFKSLTENTPTPAWSLLVWHGWPTIMVAIIMIVPSLQVIPVDTYVFSSMLFYLAHLVGLLRAAPDRFIHVTEQGYKVTLIGLIGSVSLLGFVLLADAAIFVLVHLFSNVHSDTLVQFSTLGIAAIVLFAAFGATMFLLRRSEPGERPSVSGEAPESGMKPTAHDEQTMTVIEALLSERELYRDSNLTLARIARRLGLPARDISRAVNHCRGENFSRFINGYRIRRAQELLKNTVASVTDIMLESGFSTKSNFNSEFGRIVGMTPTAFRASPAGKGETFGRSSEEVCLSQT